MTDRAALARQLAAQLGDDLDRILAPDATESAQPVRTESVSLGLELRHVAGLSAGGSMSLPEGRYDFDPNQSEHGRQIPDPSMKTFSIRVSGENVAYISAPAPGVRLDGQPVSDEVPVDRSVIDAGSSRFVVAPTRAPSRRRRAPSSVEEIDVEHRVEKIVVADYVASASNPATSTKSSKIGAVGRKLSSRRGSTPDVDRLHDRVMEVRAAAVQRHRALYPNADELLARAKAGDGHVGQILPGSKGFGVVSIAYGDLPWKAPFDRPDRIPGGTRVALEPHMILPSVPLIADLAVGPLGIVGQRHACLSVVRHIMVALRVLSPPSAMEMAILSNPGRDRDDWAWADQLPRGNSPTPAMPLLVVDGVDQLGANNLRDTLTEPGHVGAVIIDEQLADLPSICSTVVEIKPSGTVTILDFKRGSTTTRMATPCGISLEDTLAVAADLRRAYG